MKQRDKFAVALAIGGASLLLLREKQKRDNVQAYRDLQRDIATGKVQVIRPTQ